MRATEPGSLVVPLLPEAPIERGLDSVVPDVVPFVPVRLRFACFFTYDSQAF